MLNSLTARIKWLWNKVTGPKKPKYILFIRRRLFWLWLWLTKTPRPGSYPYVTGDTFRALADHIYDEEVTMKPEDVQKGDTVFVSNGLILPYLQNIHPLIGHPYILIEHNGDCLMGEDVMDLIDDKIVRFYAQNPICPHPRLVPIPLALENLHYFYNGRPGVFNKLRKELEKNPPVRKNKIFFNFSVGTNPAERGPAKAFFETQPNMETLKSMITPVKHLKLLTTYKFVISPPGNAIESCRIFEALHLKTIPIIKDLIPSQYYKEIGLPVWIVKDWKELENLSEQDIATAYDEMMKNVSWDGLYMDYWEKLIREDQDKARKL